MKTALPPWQLTTSELTHEITALETSPDDDPLGAGEEAGRRLGALYQEREGRQRLAKRLAETAGQQCPDDEPW
jgi:hypothetical protein